MWLMQCKGKDDRTTQKWGKTTLEVYIILYIAVVKIKPKMNSDAWRWLELEIPLLKDIDFLRKEMANL